MYYLVTKIIDTHASLSEKILHQNHHFIILFYYSVYIGFFYLKKLKK